MEEITEGLNNLNVSDTQKRNRIQVSNTKKPLFFYVNLAKVKPNPNLPCFPILRLLTQILYLPSSVTDLVNVISNLISQEVFFFFFNLLFLLFFWLRITAKIKILCICLYKFCVWHLIVFETDNVVWKLVFTWKNVFYLFSFFIFWLRIIAEIFLICLSVYINSVFEICFFLFLFFFRGICNNTMRLSSRL